MVRATLILAIAGVTAASPSARQEFRPSNLADLVKAVGVSRDGLEEVDLTRQVADHALYIGDGVGVSARLRDDPDGAVFVGWRRPRELWTYTFVSEEAVRAVAGGREQRRIGRLLSLKPSGDGFLLETQLPSGEVSTVVLKRDLTVDKYTPGRRTGSSTSPSAWRSP